jgi:hypothetical protein
MVVPAINVVRTVLILRAKLLLQLYGKNQLCNALKIVPNTLKNVPRIYDSMTLIFCAGPYGLYRLSSLRKSCPTPSSIFVPEIVVRQPWNACQYSQKFMLLFSSKTVHIKCCTTPQIHTVRTVLYCCMLPRNPCLLVSLGCMPLLQMLPLLKARPLSFSCSPKIE